MANIPLSEIPNAPQGVFTPTAEYNYPTDRVGDQASAQIAKGYQGMMVNPANAGLKWDVGEKIGQNIAKTTSDVAGVTMQMDAYNRERQQMMAKDSGIIKLTQNESAVTQNYYNAIKDLPVEQRPAAWLQVAGKDGENLIAGLDPMEMKVMIPHAMRTFHTGLQQASAQAFANTVQEQSAAATSTIDDAIANGKFGDAQVLKGAAFNLGHISAAQSRAYDKQITTTQQYQSAVQSMVNDPDGERAKAFRIAADLGTKVDGFEHLSQDSLKKIVQIGDVAKVDNIWGNAQNIKDQIDAGKIKDSSQIEDDATFKKLPTEAQDSVRAYIANSFAGKPEGEMNRKAGQQMVDSFPPKGADPLQSYYQNKLWIMGHVPSPFADDLLAQLDKTRKEMADNNGNKKPETSMVHYGSQILDKYMEDQVFGSFDMKKINSGKASPDQINAYTKALSVREGVMEKLKAAAPQTQQDVEKIINDNTRQIRAAQPAPKHWWQSAPPAAPVIKSTQLPDGVTPTNGKVTNYWPSEVKGDDGIKGNHNNQLAAGDLAVSPDIESELKGKGVKAGTPIRLYVQDEKGNVVPHDTKYNDSTAQDDQRIAKNEAPLRNRWDLWVKNKGASDDGAHLLDGKKVIGYQVLKNA